MELEEFLSETLKQIIKGVQVAQKFANGEGRGAEINPRGITALKKDEKGQRQPHHIHSKLPVERVEFDVAVTASDSTEKSGGAGVRVLSLNFGAQAGNTFENTTVSRIRFEVPIVLPDPYENQCDDNQLIEEDEV